MTAVVSHAERQPVDLSRLVFHSGQIGRLKTLDIVNVHPGDGFEADYVGSFRLSPLRRGMALDTKLEIYSFYIPLRYMFPQVVDMLREGPGSLVTIPPRQMANDNIGPWQANHLGVHCLPNGTAPGHYAEAYHMVFNNYFKSPENPDINPNVYEWTDIERQFGIPACHLKDYLTAPIPEAFPETASVPLVGGEVDIRNLALAEAVLHADQTRQLFATRYRDVIDMLGGFAPTDSDHRPELLQRTSTWSSGYDVNGSDQASLGQYSGRTQQAFRHTVPRFFCPEHGVVITVALARIPPVHTHSLEFYVGAAGFLDYDAIVHDPAVAAAGGASELNMGNMYIGGSQAGRFSMAFQQWHRAPAPAYVDERYYAVEGFPFLDYIPSDGPNSAIIYPAQYDAMFQSDSLGHWNIQCKTGVTVQRYLVSARSTMLNAD